MKWLNKLLNVRPGEWSRLLLLSVILIISNMGITWGTTAAYAAFLKEAGLRAGLETLTWVLLLSSVLSIPALAIYSAFVDRVDNHRLFGYIFAVGGLIIALSMALLGTSLAALAFPLIYVLSMAWLAILAPHFFTYVNDFYDIQESKRILPLIMAAGRIGASLAGFMLTFLMTYLTTETIIWIWFASDVFAVVLIWATPLILKEHKNKKNFVDPAKSASPALQQKSGVSFKQSLQEGLNFTIASSFMRWMVIGTFLLSALMTLLEYHANEILTPLFESSAGYAGFLGLLDGISNLVALAILLFGISRVTKAWGVGNTSMIFPVSNLLICFGLVGFPGLFMASFATLDRKGLRFSLQSSIEALLYNAIPLRIKGRARAFVGSLIAPIGAIAGVLLLLFQLWTGGEISWLIPAVVAFLALAYLISSFVIRYQYTQALVKMLEEEDYSFLLSEGASELVAADPATMQRLQKKLEDSASHEMRIFMTQLIAQVGGAESLSVLIPAIKSTNEARTRSAMLTVTAAAGLRGANLQEFCVALLADPDPQVRQAAASALEQLLGAKDVWLQKQWLNMVEDPDRQVVLYALRSLAVSGDLYQFESAVRKLELLLKSGFVEDKINALRVVGMINQPRAVEQTLPFLKDKRDQIRLEVVMGLEKLPLPFGNDLDAKILDALQPLLSDSVARARQAALQVIAKFKTKSNYPLFISALADKSPQVHTTAVDILANIGKDAAPALQAELNAKNPQTHKMAIVALSRINPRQFAPLVEAEVSDNLNSIYKNISVEDALLPYNAYRSVRVLLAALRENNHDLSSQILYLLSAVHDPQILEVIGESLLSDSPATRNLALEALESLTSPQTAALIASLFEPSLAPAQLLQLGQGSLHIENLDAAQALEKMTSQTESKILVLLALYAAGDMYDGLPQDAPERAALQKIAASSDSAQRDGKIPLSTVERVVILKETPFFRNIPVGDLERLAALCEEKIYEKGARIFKKDDPGGTLYIVVDGQVGIEQEKRVGSALLATIEKDSYFGEMTFFDNSPCSTTASAAQETVALQLRREPLIELARQSSEISLQLINVLSQRLREVSDRLAETTRSKPRSLHQLYDQFGE